MKGGVAAMTFAAEVLARPASARRRPDRRDEHRRGVLGRRRHGARAHGVKRRRRHRHRADRLRHLGRLPRLELRGDQCPRPARPCRARAAALARRRRGQRDREGQCRARRGRSALREDWGTREPICEHPLPLAAATWSRRDAQRASGRSRTPACCRAHVRRVSTSRRRPTRRAGARASRREVERVALAGGRAATTGWPSTRPRSTGGRTASCRWRSPRRSRSWPRSLEASSDVGRPGGLAGLDSWYDGATFTLLGGTPRSRSGRPASSHGVSVAHTIDEFVPVDDLVACAQGLAVAAMRFCGTR